MAQIFDLKTQSVRELNSALHAANGSGADSDWRIISPHGLHNIAVGIDAPVNAVIEGHVGYYCAGMNKHAAVTVRGNAGPGVAENIMSGTVRVTGSASQYAGATGRGGLLVIEGNASSRCGISMKGVDIVVRGDVGHMAAFMAQRGRLVIGGDAGDGLGDSLYEARIYVRGEVSGLGADCIEKPMKEEHRNELQELLRRAEITDIKAEEFRRYGSARRLYHFHVDNVDSY